MDKIIFYVFWLLIVVSTLMVVSLPFCLELIRQNESNKTTKYSTIIMSNSSSYIYENGKVTKFKPYEE